MQKIIVANFLKMNFLIILLMILVNCGDNNVEKNKIPITDNEGSFIIRSIETKEFRVSSDTANYHYEYTVDWGDGTIDTDITDGITHNYTKKGSYIIKIRGEYPKLSTCRNISSLEQWGNIEWKDMSLMFWGCPRITINATDAPNLKSVKNMFQLFRSVHSFNQDISNWDVSNVEDMGYMFAFAESFNQDISNWDVSNVKDMGYMFAFAEKFNQPIGKWNTSKVKDMGRMFWNAEKFDQNLSHWDISAVEYKERWISSPGHARFFGLDSMFDGVTLATDNYDALLKSWSTQLVHSNMYFSGGSSKYSLASKEARDKLINEFDWTISDGGEE